MDRKIRLWVEALALTFGVLFVMGTLGTVIQKTVGDSASTLFVWVSLTVVFQHLLSRGECVTKVS